MAHPHTLILAGALVVALGLVFAAAFAALRAAAAARRAVELAEAAAQEAARQQVTRDETLERLQDHVSRGIQILAKAPSAAGQQQAPDPEAFIAEIERLQGISASISSLAEEGLSGVLAARSACEVAKTSPRPPEDDLRRDPSAPCTPLPQPLAEDGSALERRRGIELLTAALAGWLFARFAR